MTRTTPELAILSKFPRHTNGRAFGHYIRFSVQQAPYTADLQCNRVSNLRLSGPEVETLPLGHRGLRKWRAEMFRRLFTAYVGVIRFHIK
ncbi:hypothetical protein AVEN_214559-1 [Araneus ventricosus]|uniref:Uncharacterized protein n=1 Tax=Araneus ventricosus TaxID=182803 RepID=A0A4Y2LHZ7_ARAVE|nr:hypothetical protein AVEN_214559-1 [Araneus ventricosus]